MNQCEIAIEENENICPKNSKCVNACNDYDCICDHGYRMAKGKCIPTCDENQCNRTRLTIFWTFLTKNRKLLWRIEILVKNRKLLWRIEILVKNRNCCQKIEILVKRRNSGQRSKFWWKIVILVKNQNSDQKSKLWLKIKILIKNRNYGQKF